jgi:hypothetical protein
MRTPLLVVTSALLVALALGCAGGGDTPVSVAPATTPAAAPATPATPAAPPTANAAAAPSAVGSDGRPRYYDRALTPADLEGRTLRDLSLMRNTIFARVGNPFAKPWLNDYFRAQPWYAPKDKVDISRLSAADKANVALLATAENTASRDTLVARRDAIRARATLSPEDAVELSLIGAAIGEYSGAADVPVAQRNPLEDPTVLDSQLVVAQLDVLSRRDLRLLRNTIYARHGRPFKSYVLTNHFVNQAWYTPDSSYTDARLTDIDKRNIQLVQSMEDRLGGPMTEWEQQKEEGWFEGA